MQIIDTHTGAVVEFEPGKSVETDFVTDIVNRLTPNGVGFFKTHKVVQQTVRDAVQSAILDLKTKVTP